jgi:hypothetical protein
MFQRPYNQQRSKRLRGEFVPNNPDEERISNVLKRIRPGSGSEMEDPDLWQDMTRLLTLMRQIEDLADQDFEERSEPRDEFEPGYLAWQPEEHRGDIEEEFVFEKQTVTLGPETFSKLQPFEPPEFNRAYARGEETKNADRQSTRTRTTQLSDDQLVRWWVSFSGDVSLDRLSKLRKIIDESPLTIDAHFHEICDGLIVMRVVTDNNLTMEQLDWVIGQVLDVVGIERDAAIISRN